MKVMVIVKATKNSEAGLMPSEKLLTEEEAVEWARRCPDPMPGEDAELEIRPIFEADDFGKDFTSELRAGEECLRLEVERQKNEA